MVHGREGEMAGFEWLVVAYFAVLALTSPLAHASWRRRVGVAAAAAAIGALVCATVAIDLAGANVTMLRLWLPHAYLVAGYWLPALLVEPPVAEGPFEHWLRRTDTVLRARLPRLPGPANPVVEAAYLACYPLVPVALMVVWTTGGVEDVDRFWLAVLAAGYACYGSLPWLVSRPPRLAAPRARAARSLGAANDVVLGRLSHRLNTFPSGHVAVSCAAAALVMSVSLPAGLLLGGVAAAITVGAAAGRYHYVVDVLLGMVVAAVATGVSLTFV